MSCDVFEESVVIASCKSGMEIPPEIFEICDLAKARMTQKQAKKWYYPIFGHFKEMVFV